MYEKRKKYFRDYRIYAEKMKEIVGKKVDCKIYIFGSILEGNYSIGLSDIDIAIVSEKFSDRRKKLEILDLLWSHFLDSPFEFHMLTPKQWEYYKRSIKKYEEI